MNDEELLRAWNQVTPEEDAEFARLQEEARVHNERAIRGLRRDGVLDPERAERLLDDYARPDDHERP